MSWKNVRVLVTGAGGFIGSHLAEELARRGAKLRALVRYNSRNDWGLLEELDPDLLKKIDVWSGDVTDPHYAFKAVEGCDVVFHLAALIAIPYSYVAPTAYVAANVGGTVNILEAGRRHKVKRIVHTSTSETYGTAIYAPIDEKHPLQGQSPYSASKIGADKMAESYYRSFGLPVVTVRPFNTYGPRQSARAVIPTIATQLLSGAKRLSLGATTPVRDFNFVLDTVEGFLAAGAASSEVHGEVINIGSGRGVTIGQTAQTIMRLTGIKAPMTQDRARLRPDKSEVMRLICDNRKARRLLGWKPRYSLDEGLALTVHYCQTHLSRYKTGMYNL